jgi:hypothetical protein
MIGDLRVGCGLVTLHQVDRHRRLSATMTMSRWRALPLFPARASRIEHSRAGHGWSTAAFSARRRSGEPVSESRECQGECAGLGPAHWRAELRVMARVRPAALVRHSAQSPPSVGRGGMASPDRPLGRRLTAASGPTVRGGRRVIARTIAWSSRGDEPCRSSPAPRTCFPPPAAPRGGFPTTGGRSRRRCQPARTPARCPDPHDRGRRMRNPWWSPPDSSAAGIAGVRIPACHTARRRSAPPVSPGHDAVASYRRSACSCRPKERRADAAEGRRWRSQPPGTLSRPGRPP